MSSGFASEFPTLARLALSDEHRQALRQGGFVALERRGAGKQVVKLRFRCGGRQHVRYLGASAEAGEQARRELERLQGDLHLARDVRRQVRAARKALARPSGHPRRCWAGWGWPITASRSVAPGDRVCGKRPPLPTKLVRTELPRTRKYLGTSPTSKEDNLNVR